MLSEVVSYRCYVLFFVLRCIAVAPAIVDSQSEVYAQAGANIVLRCTGQGSPTPAMCWLRDGKLVISEDNIHIMDGGVLLIANARQDQTGTYTCKATNILGAENADSQVIILSMCLYMYLVFRERFSA